MSNNGVERGDREDKDESAGRTVGPAKIPKFITKTPWYAPNPNNSESLDNEQSENSDKDINYVKKTGFKEVAHKYRKGACTNCGSLTHNAKNCVERPRKIGAKYTNQDICPDEIIQPKFDLGFEGNRDRWNGYDVSNHKYLFDEFEMLEAERRRLKFEKIQEKIKSGSGESSNTNENDEDSSEEDDIEGLRPKEFVPVDKMYTAFDSYTQTTAKNLRIRENTAKYLINLDVNSSYYDPKSRSMREDPLKGVRDENTKWQFKGDNAYRNTPETNHVKVLEAFAWEAYKRGNNVHAIAKPTQAEYMYKEHLKKKKALEEERKNMLYKKYGCEDIQKRDILEVVQKNVVEDVIDNRRRVMMKSKFEEDVYILGHTSVWGSYYNVNTKSWGYKCCLSEKIGEECRLSSL